MCSWQIHTQPAAFQDTHLQENTNQSSPVFTVSDMTINFSWTHLKNNDHSIMYVRQCGYPDSYPVPRKGFFWFLAQLMAWIFPSVPLTPNPPGTRMPLKRGGDTVDETTDLMSRLYYLELQCLSTHSALHSFCHASWYFTGSSCRVLGSKYAESIY